MTKKFPQGIASILRYSYQVFIGEILLYKSKRYSGMTVDYGKYFKLTADFHFADGGTEATVAMSIDTIP